MTRKTSLKGRIALAVSEGVVVNPYLDSVGVWTVGIGHTAAAGGVDPSKHIGRKFTIAEIMDIFERDIKKFEDIVNREVKTPLAQHEFDALVHFAFNTGTLRTKNRQPSQLLKNLNAGDKATAFRIGFHGWLKPPELHGRRDKERAMAQKGAYGSTVAPLYAANSRGKTLRVGTIDIEAELKKSTPVVAPIPTPKPAPIPQPTPQPQESFWTKLLRFFGVIK